MDFSRYFTKSKRINLVFLFLVFGRFFFFCVCVVFFVCLFVCCCFFFWKKKEIFILWLELHSAYNYFREYSHFERGLFSMLSHEHTHIRCVNFIWNFFCTAVMDGDFCREVQFDPLNARSANTSKATDRPCHRGHDDIRKFDKHRNPSIRGLLAIRSCNCAGRTRVSLQIMTCRRKHSDHLGLNRDMNRVLKVKPLGVWGNESLNYATHFSHCFHQKKSFLLSFFRLWSVENRLTETMKILVHCLTKHFF